MVEKTGAGLAMFVLDDEKDICYFIKEFFVKRGFEVQTAATGPAAVKLLKKFRPDIAMLDVYLAKGGMGGMDALKWIREQQPRCACFMVTRADDRKLAAQSMAMGAAGYLVKPLTSVSIENMVNKIVKKIKQGAK